MNLSKTTGFLLLLLLVFPKMAMGQDKLLYTQSIVKHEYLNPAYNSFRDYTSLSMFARNQWAGVTGNPKMIAANVHAPIKVAGFGAGLVLLGEDIGLRTKFQATVSVSQNVRITKGRYLALGLGAGVQTSDYDMTKANFQPGSGLYDADNLDYTAFNSVLGLCYFGKYIFSGISTELIFNKEKYEDEKLIPGVSFVIGGTARFTENILFRPDLEIKYYPQTETIYKDGNVDMSDFDPLYDLSLNFLFYDKIWLGVERRFTQSQIFSIDLVLKKQLQVGYSYEMGIGDGINNYDSHSIRLTYNFMPKNARRSFTSKSRNNIGNSFNFPYK